jgi:hypothetical protein
MSYARFNTLADAQSYADTVQAELSKNIAYIATKWSDVVTGSDGAFYVSIHATFPPDVETVADIPQTEGAD